MDLKVNINIVATRGDFINSNDKLKAGSSNKGNKNTLSSLIQPWYVLVSVRLWNFKDGGPNKQEFWPKINILKGNHCILRIRGAPVRQKLSMILGNKVRKKTFLQKMVS